MKMLKEKPIQNNIRVDCSRPHNRIFRNHVGAAYSPHVVHAALQMIGDRHLRKRIKEVLDKGYQQFGFGAGTSDLIGIQTETITQDMIGKKVGVFFAIEVKDPNHKTDPDLLEKQEKFINLINNMGGKAGFATNTLEAYHILTKGI